MVRLLKALIFLVIVGFIGLVGFAYLGDLTPEQSEMRESLTLDVD
ncbi:hypothetical protein [Rhodovulum euryhalinum]|uniref:Uncharacterized protein n=1 Tax=Rhodovulum euryhalinum TaxID=35805 RepID=A0A4R2KC28_9RHOB|nr:hypothetical protein [Rhodovulum euryhalinum]TCO69802.1 hypothetical protein EV655_11388 [Rhodovulum euryhalinum]